MSGGRCASCSSAACEPERAHEAVAIEQLCPAELRELARAVSAQHIHLKDAVLRVQKSEREHRIVRIACLQARNVVPIARDGYGVMEPGDAQRAIALWQRSAQPEIDGDTPEHQQEQRDAERDGGHSQHTLRGHGSPPRGPHARSMDRTVNLAVS